MKKKVVLLTLLLVVFTCSSMSVFADEGKPPFVSPESSPTPPITSEKTTGK